MSIINQNLENGGAAVEAPDAGAVAKSRKPVSNEELAAVIAIGLYQYSRSVHDHEALTLTINRVSRMYSPWSSKFYGLRQIPIKKYR